MKSTSGPLIGSKLVNRSSAHNIRSPCCRSDFLLSSMNHVAFQLFLTRFEMSSFSVCVVSCADTSWSLIDILILDFHIAHVVIEIRIRILSESLFTSFLNVRAADPLIRPRVMGGHSLSVVLRQIFWDVSHALACPLLAHSSHKCCSVSMTSVFLFFLRWYHYTNLQPTTTGCASGGVVPWRTQAQYGLRL